MFADNVSNFSGASKDLPPLPLDDEPITKGATRNASGQQSLDQVRNEVAASVALRAVQSSREVDGVKVGVALAMSRQDHEGYLNLIVSKIEDRLLLQQYLFIAAPAGPLTGVWPMVIFSSSKTALEKATSLANAKFLGRVMEMHGNAKRWIGYIADAGTSGLDEARFWDIITKASKIIDPSVPPRGSKGIEQLLAESRTRLERLTPQKAQKELKDPHSIYPVVLVDIRPNQQRAEHGEIPGSLVVERNVLEWRFDPRSSSRLSIADRYDLRVILFCQEGYASSLAAASLQDLGLLHATDLIGGFKAWQEAGLPTFHHPPEVEYETN